MTRDLHDQLMNYLPARMRQDAVVAGGYAACPEKANDIDLWVLGVEPDAFVAVEEEIRTHLANQGLLSSLFPPSRDSLHYEEHVGHFRVVSCQAGPLVPMGTQILITKQPTLADLLDQFDISTHAIGYYLEVPDVTFQSPRFTPITEQPRVLAFDRPEQTIDRLQKICERYGFMPHLEDVGGLALASLSQEEAA